MENLAKKVRDFLDTISKDDKYFFGRIPSIRLISEGLNNYETFKESEKILKPRQNMIGLYLQGENVEGFNFFTIFHHANPTPYEKKIKDFENGINKLYFRQIYINPEKRNEGIANDFICSNLQIAKGLKKHSIADIEKNNYKIINALEKQGFREDYRWETPKNIQMIRFFHK